MPPPPPLITRHSAHATRARIAGHFASADVCQTVTDNAWASHALTQGMDALSIGDLALLCEWAPQQWQRDTAARELTRMLSR